jgi:hypothetical protein
MTEAEWLAGDDPTLMQKHLVWDATYRKLRLFAAACCRRVWHLIPDKRSRHAVEVAESYADGIAISEHVAQARDGAMRANGFLRNGVLGQRHQNPRLAAVLSLSLNQEHG